VRKRGSVYKESVGSVSPKATNLRHFATKSNLADISKAAQQDAHQTSRNMSVADLFNKIRSSYTTNEEFYSTLNY
jgi:hypothetical protein